MEKLLQVSGIAAPLLIDNVDTDQLSPGTELFRSADDSYERWGAGLFAGWRYHSDRIPNDSFILNREPWNKAVILLAGNNFGCGSSREWAAKAIRGFGIRAILAPSFGGIFFNNCFRHGVLAAVLSADDIFRIADQVTRSNGHGSVRVDVTSNTVTSPDGDVFHFETSELPRRMLL